MNMDVSITAISFGGAAGDAVVYSYSNGGVFQDYNFIFLDMLHTATEASRKADLAASITTYATLKGYTVVKTLGLDTFDTDSSAHIANGATNAGTSLPTNFNLVSGVLGIANGLNDANSGQNDLATKYNDLATKFNTLLSALQTHGILLP